MDPYDVDGKKYVCHVCEKGYGHKQSLHKHRKLMGHRIDAPVSIREAKFKCTVCDTKFTDRSNLTRHCRKKRHELSYARSLRCVCLEEGCEETFGTLKCFICHLKEQHNYAFEEGTKAFHSESDFGAWKDNLESHLKCSFVRISGSTQKNITFTYFKCHRSCASAKKNGYTCTAHIVLKKCLQSGFFTVFYNLTHYRHENNVAMTKIPVRKKRKIASRPLSGVSPVEIVGEIKNSASGELGRVNSIVANSVQDVKDGYVLGKHNELEEAKKNCLSVMDHLRSKFEAVVDHRVLLQCNRILENVVSILGSAETGSVTNSRAHCEDIQSPVRSERKRKCIRTTEPSGEEAAGIQNALDGSVSFWGGGGDNFDQIPISSSVEVVHAENVSENVQLLLDNQDFDFQSALQAKEPVIIFFYQDAADVGAEEVTI